MAYWPNYPLSRLANHSAWILLYGAVLNRGLYIRPPPGNIWELYIQNLATHFGRKMVCNAFHNALLNTSTMGTAFLYVFRQFFNNGSDFPTRSPSKWLLIGPLLTERHVHNSAVALHCQRAWATHDISVVEFHEIFWPEIFRGMLKKIHDVFIK